MAGRESKFFMSDSRVDKIITTGFSEPQIVRIPQDVNYMRAKVVRIDWGIMCEAERCYWVLWQGDDTIGSSSFDTCDDVRQHNNSTNDNCFPLAGGISASHAGNYTMDHFQLHPDGLFINDEQFLVLNLDPTLGVGYLVGYISVLMLGVA